MRTHALWITECFLVSVVLAACREPSTGPQEKEEPSQSGLAPRISAALSGSKLPWTPGWDEFDRQLDYASSSLVYRQPPGHPSNLLFQYHLRGANPNDRYPLGIHLFWTSTSQCVPKLGNKVPSNCDVATREGVTRAFETFELGSCSTDSDGNCDKGIAIVGIAPGVYELEFNVRIPASDPNSPTCPFCSVIFQSPGPYGAGTVFVTVPAK